MGSGSLPAESTLRAAVVEVCQRMHQRGYIAWKDGNVAVRCAPGRMLVTPAGLPKGRLHPEDLVVVDEEGRPEPGQKRDPTSELAMHLAVFQCRPDVGASVHAHPPMALAHTVVGKPMSEPLLPEALVELGKVPTLAFTLPGTDQVPQAVRAHVREANVLLLERHGALTVGPDLESAYGRLEVLEHTAQVSLFAHLMAGGSVMALSPSIQASLLGKPRAG